MELLWLFVKFVYEKGEEIMKELKNVTTRDLYEILEEIKEIVKDDIAINYVLAGATQPSKQQMEKLYGVAQDSVNNSIDDDAEIDKLRNKLFSDFYQFFGCDIDDISAADYNDALTFVESWVA